VDQRVESPSWLPGGTAGADNVKDQASPDLAADGPDSGDHGRDAGSGTERASVSSYGQENSAYGQESGSYGQANSSYGPEGDRGGGAGNPVPYPAQFGQTAAGFGDTALGNGVTSPVVPVAEGSGDTSRRPGASPAASRPKAKTMVGRGRRADLVLSRLEPWSVMKFSFLISLVAWVILFVAVAVLYFALSTLGVFDSVQRTLESVTSSSGSSGVSVSKWFSASRILGYTMLIGAVNIILITAFATVGAMIYNLVTHVGGGIEVTLRETD
jgi:hypothetical protein